jgi:hypothetical protein
VSPAGGVLLTEVVRASGLDKLLTEALEPWHKPLAVQHLGKIVSDLAVSLALDGDRLADVGGTAAQPGVFGQVGSGPTSPARRTPSPTTQTGCWRRSTLPALRLGPWGVRWPVNTFPATAP